MMASSRPLPSPVRHRRVAFVLSLAFAVAGEAPANWDAAPHTVHEWGVNTVDWDAGSRLQQELPDYLHTDKRPGLPVDPPEKRVRDLPADSGIRTKPILYFYPGPRNGRGDPQADVGVEMRFAEGHANAWWPQVHKYRTEEAALEAEPPDWDGWKAMVLEDYKNTVRKSEDRGAEARWEAELADYQQLAPDDQIQWLASRFRWKKKYRFPVDERMQLVWEHLTLSDEPPAEQALPGAGLPDDHWAVIARDVDAAYVSNGSETERYVFYEGKTREEPAIALLPANGGASRYVFGARNEEVAKELAVLNVGNHPIYDVIAVYRNKEKGILWTAHIPMLPALPPLRIQGEHLTALRIPDFSRPRPGDELKMPADEFRRRTQQLLLDNLTSGFPFHSGNVMMRDPANPQAPTTMHQLFPKEAAALEKIWHDDFFEAEGLTILYRESPAYLDEAMPLNIFTSMFWHIELSRCGLVLNRHLPIDEVTKTDDALNRFVMAQFNEHLRGDIEKVSPQLKHNRFLTMGQARYQFDRRGRPAVFPGLMEKVEELFEP